MFHRIGLDAFGVTGRDEAIAARPNGDSMAGMDEENLQNRCAVPMTMRGMEQAQCVGREGHEEN